MSIPTQEPVPRVIAGNEGKWIERMIEFLSRNIQSFSLPVDGLVLPAGDNHNIVISNALMLNAKSDANFTITGIGSGSSGRILVIYNPTAFLMTISDGNPASSTNNRILTFAGDVICSVALLVYNDQARRWLMLAAR